MAGGGRDVAEGEDEEDGEVEEAGEGGEDEEAVMISLCFGRHHQRRVQCLS